MRFVSVGAHEIVNLDHVRLMEFDPEKRRTIIRFNSGAAKIDEWHGLFVKCAGPVAFKKMVERLHTAPSRTGGFHLLEGILLNLDAVQHVSFIEDDEGPLVSFWFGEEDVSIFDARGAARWEKVLDLFGNPPLIVKENKS